MPIYEYKCDKCKVVKEEIVSLSAPIPTPPCPVCGKDMERQFTSSNFRIR